MHHLTCGINSLLHSVNLIVFTLLLVHLILRISPHHSHPLRSHHLSLPRPFTPDLTRKPSYRWQTRATGKSAKNCSNSTCLQRCRWRYWPIFIRLTVVASEICEIPRNSLKIQTYGVQGHPRSSILVLIEKPICDLLLVINSNVGRICYRFRDIDAWSWKIAEFSHPTLFWGPLAAERH